MPLTITDDQLRAMQMDEQAARVEIACRLFDAGKLSFGHAAAMAGVTKEQLEQEIKARGIPRYRYTEEDFERDLGTLQRLESKGLFRKPPAR